LIFALLSSLAWAELPAKPSPPDIIPGQCAKVFPINKGQPLPVELSIDLSSASCSAVAVPLSDYADLLSLEKWGNSTYKISSIEISQLQMERDWYKNQLNDALKPKPWLERPATQRWLGRIETIVIVGVVTAGLGATYYYTSGAGK
jgi:hypothetical protein|tara:strand:- start:3278 stop:3715 length:438 start_codon:yes stop_codon:yes gene_type:complete